LLLILNFQIGLQIKKSYASYGNTNYKDFNKKEKIVIVNINEASKEDLMKIYGIGDAISDRILKQKEVFGSFVSMDQMQDIWGLSPDVITQLNSHFKVSGKTITNKIDINNISTKELTKFPYFKYALAKEIVTYRSMNNGIKNIEELTKIKGFPIDKIKIIALYLKF
jgi:DNA uptake protein ComE-like DNA-binding protein